MLWKSISTVWSDGPFPFCPMMTLQPKGTDGRDLGSKKGGRTPPFVDGQIAAIAHSQGLTLVTANTEDFRYFDELELADWDPLIVVCQTACR